MPILGLNIFDDHSDSPGPGTGQRASYDDSVVQLPCLPQALLALINSACSKSESIDSLASIVRLDPVLTLNILATVPKNGVRFTCLEDVMSVLGQDGIAGLARSIAFHNHFSSHLDNYSSFPDISRHSVLTGLLASELAEQCKYRSPDEAYLAGLLHDIGRLALGSLNIDASGKTLIKAEKELYGSSHVEVGAELVSFMTGSSFIPDAVRYHHTNLQSINDAHPLVKIVYVANALCSDSDVLTVEQVATLLSLTGAEIKNAVENAARKLNDVQKQSQVWIDKRHVENARVLLASKVKKYGMMYAYLSQLLSVKSEQELYAGLLRISRLLFKPEAQLLFVVDPEQNILKGVELNSPDNVLVSELSVSLASGNSILNRVLKDREPVSILSREVEDTATVIDRQIISLLKTERVVYIPVADESHQAGVLLLGYNVNENSRTGSNEELYRLFMGDVTEVVSSCKRILQGGAETKIKEAGTTSNDLRHLVHEVSTPLSVIKNYLAVLSVKFGDDKGANEDIRVISEEIDRVHGVIRSFANTENKLQKKSVDINAVINDVVKVLNEGLFKNSKVSIKTDLEPGLKPVVTNQDSIKQILINLVKNAMEALGDNGGIKIRTRGNFKFDDIDYLEISIGDNGPGIPDDIFKNLFHKVKSTKGNEHGGLGLSIVYKLVQQLNGKISCRTKKNKGTIFQVFIPRTN